MTDPDISQSRELDRSLLSGIGWTAILRWSAQIVSWGGTFYGARLLAPTDYGIVAMAMLPIGLLRLVEDFGLDAIFVQDRHIGPDSQRQLAGLGLLLGGGLSCLLAVASRPIADFFRQPQVAPMIVWLCLLLVLDAAQIIPRAMLQRQLEFRRLALLAFVEVVCTQATLVVAARSGFGYRSLVVNALAGEAAATALLIWWHPYAVRFPRDWSSISRPVAQGWRVIVSRASWFAYSNADQTIVGRFLGASQLGIYSFANTFANLPTREISAIVSRVVPGVFSEVQSSPAELRRYFLLLTEFVCYLALPIAAGIALTADVGVSVAMGHKWAPVVAPLRILCITAAFSAAQMLVAHVMMWTGRFRAFMWCSLLAAAVLPLAVLIGARFGLSGVAWAWAFAFPLVTIPSLVIAFRAIDVTLWSWLGAIAPAGTGCAIMSVVVMLVRARLPDGLSEAATLGVLVGSGAATYLVSVLTLYRARLFALMTIVRGALGSSRPQAGETSEHLVG